MHLGPELTPGRFAQSPLVPSTNRGSERSRSARSAPPLAPRRYRPRRPRPNLRPRVPVPPQPQRTLPRVGRPRAILRPDDVVQVEPAELRIRCGSGLSQERHGGMDLAEALPQLPPDLLGLLHHDRLLTANSLLALGLPTLTQQFVKAQVTLINRSEGLEPVPRVDDMAGHRQVQRLVAPRAGDADIGRLRGRPGVHRLASRCHRRHLVLEDQALDVDRIDPLALAEDQKPARLHADLLQHLLEARQLVGVHLLIGETRDDQDVRRGHAHHLLSVTEQGFQVRASPGSLRHRRRRLLYQCATPTTAAMAIRASTRTAGPLRPVASWTAEAQDTGLIWFIFFSFSPLADARRCLLIGGGLLAVHAGHQRRPGLGQGRLAGGPVLGVRLLDALGDGAQEGAEVHRAAGLTDPRRERDEDGLGLLRTGGRPGDDLALAGRLTVLGGDHGLGDDDVVLDHDLLDLVAHDLPFSPPAGAGGRLCGVGQRHVDEAREVQLRGHGDRVRRAVAVLGHDEVGLAGPRRLLVVVVVAVKQDHDVRILLYAAGFAQVRELRALVLALLRATVQLAHRDDRALDLLRQEL